MMSMLTEIQTSKKKEELKSTFTWSFVKWFAEVVKIHSGTLSIAAIIKEVGKFNEDYKSLEQQDAQEFMQWIFNQLAEEARKHSLTDIIAPTFEGRTLASTKCMYCEKVSSVEEAFMFLSLEIERCTSLTDAIHNKFLAIENLNCDNKFFCENCATYQEAEKIYSFKKLPMILIIQFKRFRYIQEARQFRKLDYQIQFPFEIRIPSSQHEQAVKPSLYALSGIIMHIGYGIQAGHYYSIIRIGNKWVEFDDSKVREMKQEHMEALVECKLGTESGGSACPYILVFTIAEQNKRT
jgi:ubiquitin C-terminal hydrolase